MYIACPRCDWHPTPDIKWTCSCGHMWHTFDTHGVCPACGTVWAMTQCSTQHGCGVWSDHEEWYHDEDGFSVGDYIPTANRDRGAGGRSTVRCRFVGGQVHKNVKDGERAVRIIP
jgi:phage terminase large subunit GpA-like protein